MVALLVMKVLRGFAAFLCVWERETEFVGGGGGAAKNIY